jgi:hypothetical protein
MPVTISANQQEEAYEKVKDAFIDFPLFDKLVSKQLKQAIADSNTIDIDAKSVRKITEKYFDVNSFQTEQQKLLLAQIHLILRTAFVVVLSFHENLQPLLWKDVPTLLEHYPQFQGQEEDELNYLLKFRNYLRLSLIIIPARLNKQMLLKIAARLEGSRQEYITGGGQKPGVTRRVEIYEQEGNIQPEKRQDRIRPPKLPGKKRGNPLKDLKLLRLPSEEVRTLTKTPTEQERKTKHRNSLNNNNNNNNNNATNNNDNNNLNNHPMMGFPLHSGMTHSLPHHPFYAPLPYGMYGHPGIPPYMDYQYYQQQQQSIPLPPNSSSSSSGFPAAGFPCFDEVVGESYEDLLAFNTPRERSDNNPNNSGTERRPAIPDDSCNDNSNNNNNMNNNNNNNNSSNTGSGNSYPFLPPHLYSMYPMFPPPISISIPPSSHAVPSSSSSSNNNNNNNYNLMPSKMPRPERLPSSHFPPSLSREQSELIDRLFIPGDSGDFWNLGLLSTPRAGVVGNGSNLDSGINSNSNSGGGGIGATTPKASQLALIRDISWDIYNGSFGDDLKNILGPEW